MGPPAFDLRTATSADADAIAAVTAEGFETYRSFAPPGWEPPELTPQETRERFLRPDSAGFVATAADDEVVGVSLHVPARAPHPEGAPIAGLGHVAAVFVAQPWWGRGVATALLGALVEDMTAAGYREARLFTPEGQARARAFYAREGWREVTGAIHAPFLGLDVVELRRAL